MFVLFAKHGVTIAYSIAQMNSLKRKSNLARMHRLARGLNAGVRLPVSRAMPRGYRETIIEEQLFSNEESVVLMGVDTDKVEPVSALDFQSQFIAINTH